MSFCHPLDPTPGQADSDPLLRNASDGIHILDRNGNVIEASDSFCRMLGYSREEVIGMNVLQWEAHFRDRQEIIQVITDQLSTDSRSEFQTKHRRKDGSVFDVEVSGCPVRLGGDLVLFNSSRDITERLRVQREMELMQFITDHLAEGVSISDERGRLVYVNKAFVESLGYARDAVLSMRIGDFDPNYREESWPRHWEDLKRNGSLTFETTHRTRSGETIPVEIAANYIRYGGQEYNCAYVRYIAARKTMEQEVRIAATAFESQVGMLITDENANILRVNGAFTRITGYSAAEVIGRNPRILHSGRQSPDFYKALWQGVEDSGYWSGELWNRRKNGELFAEHLTITAVKDGDGRVTNYVGSLSDITPTKKTEEEIQRLVLYDPLTNLPNRRMLMDRLQVALAAAARTGRAGALLFIDLDNFKIVNDTRGHAVGDWLLQQVGNRLASEVREDDTVARLGGDEFIVMLQNLAVTQADASERAAAVAEKIIRSLAVPFVSAESRFLCTPSIGVTLFQDGRAPPEELLKQADIAMYEAKKSGRNTLKFYDRKVQEAITARVTLEAELRRAIEANEFALHYQVKVDRRGQPVGAEALIRWCHPARGIVPPAQFIPLLEETGLIIPAGLWILDTACRQVKRWEERDETRDLVLAINVSAKQFHQPDFVDQVRKVVARHAIDPQRLELEITESVLLDDTEAVIAAMRALRQYGVRLALDDFGTGYSSLNYLRKLPLNVMKIDQSFVQELGPDTSEGAIVQTIIAMAKILDLVVVAEGVETRSQKQYLDDWGCARYQGYLFGRPMPIEQFEASLPGRSLAAT
ncbi:diguanylate cyclase/phosphodiesterase with PAS/PAC sensor [Burkholderiales bacterium GJ-E10]|nr:diguanylate cyclase/phosphodiesterase with PAS/PAC sensor [Burkholderiales bacterium GJ-E10]